MDHIHSQKQKNSWKDWHLRKLWIQCFVHFPAKMLMQQLEMKKMKKELLNLTSQIWQENLVWQGMQNSGYLLVEWDPYHCLHYEE
uniref:BEACH domain-containing protein lvsA-like n=1 Tax=Rhizophora mucronata TaxID=61149 RepID=A0A2P2MDF4_RHIMU